MVLCSDHTKLVHRINRIEGQVKGLRKMVESDRNCFDVLKQVAAILGATRSLGGVILEDHLTGCVTDAIRKKDKTEELIQEVIAIFNKFTK